MNFNSTKRGCYCRLIILGSLVELVVRVLVSALTLIMLAAVTAFICKEVCQPNCESLLRKYVRFFLCYCPLLSQTNRCLFVFPALTENWCEEIDVLLKVSLGLFGLLCHVCFEESEGSLARSAGEFREGPGRESCMIFVRQPCSLDAPTLAGVVLT
jgi:hypothetical protein